MATESILQGTVIIPSEEALAIPAMMITHGRTEGVDWEHSHPLMCAILAFAYEQNASEQPIYLPRMQRREFILGKTSWADFFMDDQQSMNQTHQLFSIGSALSLIAQDTAHKRILKGEIHFSKTGLVFLSTLGDGQEIEQLIGPSFVQLLKRFHLHLDFETLTNNPDVPESIKRVLMKVANLSIRMHLSKLSEREHSA